MSIKFKLTDETKINDAGVKLYRIEATVDIEAHGIKKGDKGGWVQSERLSSGEPRISGEAWVYSNAQVYGDARVYGNACVSGEAWVYSNAQVYGDARVYGNACVYGEAWVYGDALVYGNAQVCGDALVYGNAQVYGEAWVYDNARVFDNAQVYGDARVYGNADLRAKKGYSRGRFIGGDDSDEPTFAEITDKTGSDYWKHQYVIGDYKIDDLDEPEVLEMTVSDVEKLVGHKVRTVEEEK